MAAYLRVRDLRAAQGLRPLERSYHYHEIPPDFGPVPISPGMRVATGEESTWLRLLGSLNAGDLDQIVRCLGELEARHPPRHRGPQTGCVGQGATGSVHFRAAVVLMSGGT